MLYLFFYILFAYIVPSLDAINIFIFILLNL